MNPEETGEDMAVANRSRLLVGKYALVVGVANEESIAYGIAQKFLEHGAKVIYSCHPATPDIERVIMTLGVGGRLIPADLASEEDTKGIAKVLELLGIKLDIVVHSAAFIHPKALRRPLYQLSKKDFEQSMSVTAFSFVSLVGGLVEQSRLNEGASIMAMTFSAASKRVLRWYKGEGKSALETSVRTLADELGKQGIRVNAISSAPCNTKAARAIPHFKVFYKVVGKQAPLQRTIGDVRTGNVFPSDIGGVAVCLASDLMGAVTGHILEVDCGFGNMVAFPVNFAGE